MLCIVIQVLLCFMLTDFGLKGAFMLTLMQMIWVKGRKQVQPVSDAALKSDCKHLMLSRGDVCCSPRLSVGRANGTTLCNFDPTMEISCPSRVGAQEAFLVNITRVTATNQSALSKYDFIEVGLMGVSISLCIRASSRVLNASAAFFTFECMVADPGLYSVHTNLIYEGRDGLDFSTGATSRYLRRRANVLSVPRRIEILPLPNSNDAGVLPAKKCLDHRRIHRGRWLQRRHVCAQTHPLCRVPPSGSGWQYVPYECYYERQTVQRMQQHLRNRTIVFTGDSTMRFLWGQFINLLVPPGGQQFSQTNYGQMRSELLYVYSNDGAYKHSFDECDRYKISEYHTAQSTRLIYYQVSALGISGAPASTCEQLDLRAFTAWMKRVGYVDVLLINKHYLAKFGCTSVEQQRSDTALLYQYNHLVESISRHVIYRSMLAWHDSALQEHCASLQLVHSYHSLKMQLQDERQQYLDLFSMTHSLTFFEPTDSVHLTYQDNAVLAQILAAVFTSYF